VDFSVFGPSPGTVARRQIPANLAVARSMVREWAVAGMPDAWAPSSGLGRPAGLRTGVEVGDCSVIVPV
jgi:hypothetical protein